MLFLDQEDTATEVLAATGALHDAALRHGEAARLADLEDQSRCRIAWPAGRWPAPDTPKHINSAFGRYTVPLMNLGGRDEFLLEPLTPMGFLVPLLDGSYGWGSFGLSFWMPDGAGVATEVREFLSYAYGDGVRALTHLPRDAVT